MYILEKLYKWIKNDFWVDKILTNWIGMWIICGFASFIFFIASTMDATMHMKDTLIAIGLLIILVHGVSGLFLTEELKIKKMPWKKTYIFLSVLCLYAIGIVGTIYFDIFMYLPTFFIMVFLIGELVFFLDDEKPKKNIFWFTVGKKCIAFLEVGLFMVALNGLYYVTKAVANELNKHYFKILSVIFTGLFWIIMAGVCAAILYGYIKLNTFKYTHKKKKKK